MLLVAVAMAAGCVALVAAPPPVLTADASAPGVDGAVFWIAVAPDFRRSGMVLAAAGAPQCSHDCMRLWSSHDGGATWRLLPARGWSGGRVTVATTAAGAEVVFADAAAGVQRSDDGGASWRTVGGAGVVAVSPDFAADSTVAVAGADTSHGDYRLDESASSPVAGSSGDLVDLGFMLAGGPAGRYAPALLSAADRTTGAPVVAQCDAALRCHAAATLACAGPFALPVSLHPSSTYASDGTVFAKAGRSLFKSTDGGRSFVPLVVLPDHGGSATAYPMLALAPGYSESGAVRTVYAAVVQVSTDRTTRMPTTTGGVYRSPDGGATWTRLGSPSSLDGGASAVAVAADGRLFAGYLGSQGAAGLLCSVDGVAWRTACPPLVPSDRTVSSLAERRGGGDVQSCAPMCAPAPSAVAAAGAATSTPPHVASPHRAGGLAADVQPGGRATPALLLVFVAFVACAAMARAILITGRRVSPRRPTSGASPGRRNTSERNEVTCREKQASG